MLFDRDEDGVLSFQELQLVMKSMGQRPSGQKKYFLLIDIEYDRTWSHASCNIILISTCLS